MESPNGFEKAPNIDFLNEEVEIVLSINEEAAAHLPEVSKEDLETRKEKYRLLLGSYEGKGNAAADVAVRAILELDRRDPVFFREEQEEVSGVNIRGIQRYVEDLKALNPEIAELELIGDIHTHPVLPRDFENTLNPWNPSPGDIESVANDYRLGVLSADRPFIFGIAGPDETGETQYAFYRIVSKDGTYKAIAVT